MSSAPTSHDDAAPVHEDALEPTSRLWLPQLARRDWAPDAYLAGSAALALHLGHRRVRDLDLMSLSQRLAPPDRRDLLADLLAMAPGTQVETARDGYLFARLPDGVGLRFFWFPYPLVDPQHDLDGLAVASLVDLGLMKVAAAISRATARDLLDLHAVCRVVPLAELLERSGEKFGHVRDFPLQAWKALAEASQLSPEPLPELCDATRWEHVAAWARDEVRRAARVELGLG